MIRFRLHGRKLILLVMMIYELLSSVLKKKNQKHILFISFTIIYFAFWISKIRLVMVCFLGLNRYDFEVDIGGGWL